MLASLQKSLPVLLKLGVKQLKISGLSKYML